MASKFTYRFIVDWNRLVESFLMARPKLLLFEFGIHHSLESFSNKYFVFTRNFLVLDGF